MKKLTVERTTLHVILSTLDFTEKDELCSITGVFLSHLAQAQCSWNIKFYEKENVEKITTSLMSEFTSLQREELNFTYFSQD
jgi:hypothetical protein